MDRQRQAGRQSGPNGQADILAQTGGRLLDRQTDTTRQIYILGPTERQTGTQSSRQKHLDRQTKKDREADTLGQTVTHLDRQTFRQTQLDRQEDTLGQTGRHTWTDTLGQVHSHNNADKINTTRSKKLFSGEARNM